MKNSNNHLQSSKLMGRGIRRLIPSLAGVVLFALCVLTGTLARAQINLLTNPGAETGSFSGWTQFNNAGYNFGTPTNNGVSPHSGTYPFWMFGDYNIGGTDVYCGFYQFNSAHAGEVFTADGWAYQLSTDNFPAGDGNNAFIEVTFQDVGGNTLARYRSSAITTGFTSNTWVDLGVTNQYDPNTYAFIGTVTNLVAPANTVRAEYDVVFDLHNGGGGSTYWDDLQLLAFAPPPPYITNAAPIVILATNDHLTFTAVAQSGVITNVQVTVVATGGLVNPTTTTNVYTSAGTNLTISGLNTATANVSLPLASNTIYSINILVTDSNEGNAVLTDNFDTLRPVLVWEAEDFNYNGGSFTDTTPDGGLDVTLNQVGTQNIDENKIGGPTANGGGNAHFYRPTDAVSIQSAGEQPRQKFLDGIAAGNTNAIDEEVGYNSPGDWIDFTRTFPSNTYNVYARLATVGSGTMLSFAHVSDPTAGSQTVTNLGTFSFSDNGWNTYHYVPLKDNFGNLVPVPLNGVQTLRSTVVGNPNINFFMIVPAVGSQNPALLSSYPTGLHPFEPTNHLTFTIGPASGSPIPGGSIHMSLNGYDVTSLMTLTSGASNTWTGSIPVASNAAYTAVIRATNSTSLSSTFTINFDTFTQNNFMWEAEDFDFNGGSYIDNPVPTGDDMLTGTGNSAVATGSPAANSYFYYPAGNPANQSIYGVDFTTQGSADNSDHYYRPFDDCGTELNFDYLRQKFIDAQNSTGDTNIGDFDIGWWNTGWWLNYTRTYPTGQFYVYGRLAGGSGPFSGTTLSMVTGGQGSTNQTTQLLGSFADPNASGWQTWHWVPMLDSNNHQAVVTLGGVATLRATSGANLNANYFMLVPAASTVSLSISMSGSNPALSFPTQAGFSYTVLYKNSLADAAWKALTIVAGDGTTKVVPDATGGAQRFYKLMVQ
jgi:hypothetical protein